MKRKSPVPPESGQSTEPAAPVARKRVRITRSIVKGAGSYTEELADEICAHIAAGSNLHKISRMPGMHAAGTMFGWLAVHPTFAGKYARAREVRADARLEKMDEIVEMMIEGSLGASEARVAIDALKWQVEKEKPKREGEKAEKGEAEEEAMDITVTIGGAQE